MKVANLPITERGSAVDSQVVDVPPAWSRCRLGDVLHVKHGYAFKGEFFASAGERVVLTPGNFRPEGGFEHDPSNAKYYSGDFPAEFLLDKGSLLVAMTDLKQDAPILGAAAFVPEADRFLHNQRLGKVVVTCPAAADLSYLYYLFNSAAVRAQIRASATGSTVRHTAPERIYGVEAAWPPVQVQRKIASILSACDDLIENTLRRIKILEEMAQSLYKEWFVDFRFPGHEDVKMVDSLLGIMPEGWEITELGSLASEIREGTHPNAWDLGTPYVGLEHIPRQSLALAEWGSPGDAASSKLVFRKGDVLFGKIRPYFHKVAVAPVNGICSTDAIVIRPKESSFLPLVASIVSSVAFVEHATATSQGTKMPRADWRVLKQYPVLLADHVTLHRYLDQVGAMLDLIQTLVPKSRNLRQTRDLLLPKLISGEIDVSDLDIDIGEDAA